jgi:NADH:ubiquinone oxidoreductase subunit 6 (subunit J)
MKGDEPLRTNYAGAIYGTILSMAIISTSSKDPDLGAVAIAGWAVATAFVFFLAHVYSSIVARGFARPAKAIVLVREESRREWPMVQGALVPAAVMLLAPLGVIPEENASYFAVWTGVAMLFGAGLVIGRNESLGWGRSLIIASINSMIGLMIVSLKIFVH